MIEALPSPGTAVRLAVNGSPVEVASPAGRRLLDVLRDDLGLTGAKEGCGEGECGACAVLLDGSVVNSCLVPVGGLDGARVLTVEGLAADGTLSALQQAFLDHGSVQCGMCTPGLLMAAAGAIAAVERPLGRGPALDAIAGNLCRCTGYTKVVEAVASAGAGMGRASTGSTHAPLRIVDGAGTGPWPNVVRAASVDDACRRLADDPTLRVIAGGTDVMAAIAARGPASHPGRYLDVSHLAALRGLRTEGADLVIGATTTWTELLTSPTVAASAPALAAAAAEFGGPAIRNRATVGGNCVTASPSGDLIPLLLAAGAELETTGPIGGRRIPAAEFWTGYRRTALEPGELLTAIRIPVGPGRRLVRRKVAGRRALGIAVVSLALGWTREPEAAGWHDVRVALGAVAPTVVRAPSAEALLEGVEPSRALADAAGTAVLRDIAPIDDVRATAAYRRAVASRALRRLVLDTLGRDAR